MVSDGSGKNDSMIFGCAEATGLLSAIVFITLIAFHRHLQKKSLNSQIHSKHGIQAVQSITLMIQIFHVWIQSLMTTHSLPLPAQTHLPVCNPHQHKLNLLVTARHLSPEFTLKMSTIKCM